MLRRLCQEEQIESKRNGTGFQYTLMEGVVEQDLGLKNVLFFFKLYKLVYMHSYTRELNLYWK